MRFQKEALVPCSSTTLTGSAPLLPGFVNHARRVVAIARRGRNLFSGCAMRFTKIIFPLLVFLCAVAAGPSRAFAQNTDAPKGGVITTAGTIPVGTVVTAANWGNYRQFMPDG